VSELWGAAGAGYSNTCLKAHGRQVRSTVWPRHGRVWVRSMLEMILLQLHMEK